MGYVKNVAINKNRILNHVDLIKKKHDLLDLPTQDKENEKKLLSRAGHIELQLTDQCPLNCDNCHFRGLGDYEFSFDWLNHIVEFIKPKAITLAGGGEPTIYSRFNEAVLKLAKIKQVKIGLITNGVLIPKGGWTKHISWVRVSVYSVVNGMYSGRSSKLLDTVMDNIKWYLQKSKIPNVGIHFLFYRNNVSDIVPFAKGVYNRFKGDKENFEKIHVQFKVAFIMARPTKLTPELHKKNIESLPTHDQIERILLEFENEFAKDENFKNFLQTQSNFELFHNLTDGHLTELINVTNLQKFDNSKPKNSKCYVSLAYQLIDPKGYIYPCLTLAEHRIKKFAIGHITDLPFTDSKKLKDFYLTNTECCNKTFCRNWVQNKIVSNCLNGTVKTKIPNDDFF